MLSVVNQACNNMLSMHPGEVPSLAGAANQINILKKELKLEKVFLATDAPEDGMTS